MHNCQFQQTTCPAQCAFFPLYGKISSEKVVKNEIYTSVEAATILQNWSFSSPPLRPPIAKPGVSRSINSLAHSLKV